MTEKNWTTWEEWYSFTQENGRNLDDPFPNQRITENTIFVWSEMTTPMPCSSTGGTWAHFPDAGAACGFLRHLLLPQFFEIWLVREEWDADPESHIMAEDLFDRAIGSGQCRYADDIPEMREVIALLDQAIESDSSEDCFQVLEKSVEKFSHFWADTTTWCFQIEVRPVPYQQESEWAKDGSPFSTNHPQNAAVPVARQRQTSRPAQNSRRI